MRKEPEEENNGRLKVWEVNNYVCVCDTLWICPIPATS